MFMRFQFAGIGIAVFLCLPCAQAQESLAGTYKGSFEVMTAASRRINVALTLDITSAANGKLAGKARHGGGNCAGEFSLEGSYEGAKVEIKVGEGAIRGCGNFTANFTAQGDKLVGLWGKNPVELSK